MPTPTSSPLARHAAVLLSCALSACTSGGEPIDAIGPEGTQPAAIVVSPAATVAAPAGLVEFVVDVRDASGGRLTPSITWTADGGTVQGGRFTAPTTPGSYRVVASVADGSVADTAFVVVAMPQALTLSPAEVAVAPGESEQLAVTASFADGTSAPVAVAFSATGGTVSEDGLYVAGSAPGAYRVIAVHAASGLADTSTVSVGAAAPGTGAGAGANQPAGFTAVFDHALAARPPADPSADAWRFKVYGEQPHLTHQPASGTAGGALRVTYPTAFGTAFAVGEAPAKFVAGYGFPPNGGNLYCRVRWRSSPNWHNAGGGGIKFFFYRFGGNDQNHYFGFHRNSDSDDTQLAPILGMQWRWGMSYPANTYYSNHDVADGQWHDLEYLVLANTPGVANGTGAIWVDGVRRLHRTDVTHFVSGQTPRIDYLWVDPTYGRTPPSQVIWFEIDHWYCSVK